MQAMSRYADRCKYIAQTVQYAMPLDNYQDTLMTLNMINIERTGHDQLGFTKHGDPRNTNRMIGYCELQEIQFVREYDPYYFLQIDNRDEILMFDDETNELHEFLNNVINSNNQYVFVPRDTLQPYPGRVNAPMYNPYHLHFNRN